jgi:hypothetical protein
MSNHPNRHLIEKARFSINSVEDYMASSDIFDDNKKQEMTKALEDFANQVKNIETLPINPAKTEETEALLKLLGLHIAAAGAEIGCNINYAKFYEWYDKEYPNTY